MFEIFQYPPFIPYSHSWYLDGLMFAVLMASTIIIYLARPKNISNTDSSISSLLETMSISFQKIIFFLLGN